MSLALVNPEGGGAVRPDTRPGKPGKPLDLPDDGGQSVPIQILPPVGGQLEVALYREENGHLAAWNNGVEPELQQRSRLGFGIALTNDSNTPMGPDSRPRMTVKLPAGLELVSVHTAPPHGDAGFARAPAAGHWAGRWNCTPGAPVRCQLANAPRLEQNEALPMALFAVRTQLSERQDDGRIRVQATTTGADGQAVAGTNFAPVTVLERDRPNLALSLAVPQQVRAGGTGRVMVTVNNHGDLPATRPVVKLPLASGVRMLSGGGGGWSCSPAASRCTHAGSLPAGRALPAFPVRVRIAESAIARTVNLRGTATTPVEHVGPDNGASITVPIASGLVAQIAPHAPEVTESIRAGSRATPPTFTLNGGALETGNVPVSYGWTQLCTTAAEVRADRRQCPRVTPRVRYLGLPKGVREPNGPNASFNIPDVTGDTTLRFQLTAESGGDVDRATTAIGVSDNTTPATRAERLQQLSRSKVVKVARQGRSAPCARAAPRADPGARPRAAVAWARPGCPARSAQPPAHRPAARSAAPPAGHRGEDRRDRAGTARALGVRGPSRRPGAPRRARNRLRAAAVHLAADLGHACDERPAPAARGARGPRAAAGGTARVPPHRHRQARAPCDRADGHHRPGRWWSAGRWRSGRWRSGRWRSGRWRCRAAVVRAAAVSRAAVVRAAAVSRAAVVRAAAVRAAAVRAAAVAQAAVARSRRSRPRHPSRHRSRSAARRRSARSGRAPRAAAATSRSAEASARTSPARGSRASSARTRTPR